MSIILRCGVRTNTRVRTFREALIPVVWEVVLDTEMVVVAKEAAVAEELVVQALKGVMGVVQEVKLG